MRSRLAASSVCFITSPVIGELEHVSAGLNRGIPLKL